VRRQRRSFKFLALILGLALVAAACGGDDDDDDQGATDEQPSGEAGGDLVDLQNFAQGEPDHIDPALAGVLQGAQIGALLYDGLTEFDFSGEGDPELKGQVADKWESDDGQTWVFTLKDGQTFSDGTPVLPSSFKKAWDRAASAQLASEINYLYAPIKGATAVTEGTATEIEGVTADDDAMTLTVELEYPFYDWPAVVSHPVFSPMPDAAFELSDPTQWEQGVMIGNGPFKQEDPWEHEVGIKLVRNDDWAGGIYGDGTKAKLDSIDFKISADLDSAFADFEAGNGDTGYIPAGRFAEATENPDWGNATEGNLGIYHFGINTESQLGGDENLKLREAIAMGIDRDAINQTVYDGSRRLPTGITPPGVPGYKDGLCGDLCTFDKDKATSLVEEWKADGGTLDHPIKINFNTGSGHEEVVAIIQQNLQDIGLEAELDGRDPTNYFTEMRQGACELCRAGWIWDYPVQDNALYALLDSASIDGDNLSRYSNPDVDDMISEARSTEDADKRNELYNNAEEQALKDVAYVPINWYNGQIVYTKDKVENLVQTPLQFVLYENITLKS
jgi:oligopeptide transport system substrate-binding protein